jgi:hypothetical protein
MPPATRPLELDIESPFCFGVILITAGRYLLVEPGHAPADYEYPTSSVLMLTNLHSSPRVRRALNEYSGYALHGPLYCLRSARLARPDLQL